MYMNFLIEHVNMYMNFLIEHVNMYMSFLTEHVTQAGLIRLLLGHPGYYNNYNKIEQCGLTMRICIKS